ncbi:hypothetical protein KP509_13G098200 [Ceratopteris richardii]|uniref:Uncharacterized protein n=1 Tax=Ceratopteris richardii TaxID=49495 RepID=A0A8T2TNS5_CERRI|nr:hypothetical protein KP509_13G098200 [Ceratopteris richardii]
MKENEACCKTTKDAWDTFTTVMQEMSLVAKQQRTLGIYLQVYT